MHERAPQLDSLRVRREHARMLVLASASPRRQQLLRWLQIEYAIDPPEVDESVRPGEAGVVLVERLAAAKAAAVAARRPMDWILAADTVVEIDGELLNKPADRPEAAAMLRRLAGREHRVLTGFTLLAPGAVPRAGEVVVTRVHFRPLGPAEVAAYVASGEPDGKAGGYAIQGFGAGLVSRIDGSFTNVIGLPLDEVGQALAEAGLRAG
jgi:septum formation protein